MAELSDDVKRMDITEFMQLGFLQEANRQFFHPLGLALEVIIEEDGSCRLGGIWDYREDPEGIVFADPLEADKSAMVSEERKRHEKTRIALFGGWVIQPVEDHEDD